MTEQEIETFTMLENWSDPKRPRPVNFMSQDYLERLSKFVAVVKAQQERIEQLEAAIAAPRPAHDSTPPVCGLNAPPTDSPAASEQPARRKKGA